MVSKDIAIFVMSTFRNKPEDREKSLIEYNDKDGIFNEMCEHTNEAALKYISWKLKQDNKNLAAAFGFLTDEAQKDFPRFQALFADYDFNIEQVPLYNNGDLTGSFKSICQMFDVLRGYINENEEVVIHIDITGGPRHSVMLMLALIQMIKFSGAKVGMVIYANVLRKKSQNDMQKGMIEDVGDIMDMFTLISGAEEFNSFGSIEQIKKYFDKNIKISMKLKYLLVNMDSFSINMKLCTRYEDIIDTLQRLKSAINIYEQYLKNNNDIKEQEVFFGKLLPIIKMEYFSLLPQKDEGKQIEIIKWCIQKGFLQQALTFFTEWIPKYLIESNVICIKENKIKDNCIENAKIKSNWQEYFFKAYKPSKYISKNNVNVEKIELITYEKFKKYINDIKSEKDIVDLQDIIKNKNTKLEKFIKEVINFNIKENIFIKKIVQKPKHDLLKKCLVLSAKNTNINEFLNAQIKKYNSVKLAIVKSLINMDEIDAIEIFNLVNKEYDKIKIIDDLALERKNVFEFLLKNRLISTKLSEKIIVYFIALYNQCVRLWRNTVNHADGDIVDNNKLIEISRTLMYSIALIDVKK